MANNLSRKLRWWWLQARIKLGMAGPKGAASASKKGATPSKKGARSKAPPSRYRWVKRLFLLAFFAGLVGVTGVVGLFLYYGLDPDLPKFNNVGDYEPKVVTRILDRNGELIGELFEERRTVVPASKIPAVVKHAFVDAEDAEFYQHSGLSYWGLFRAVLNNLRPGAHLQGASTITQQLVKTYILKTNERTVKRKVQEMILAHRLDKQLSKDEILSIYLNQIYFGHGRYGIEEASRFYFGKSVADVNAGEAAVLASLPKGPEEISPVKHPERAKERQIYVLGQMLRYGHITQAEHDEYVKSPIQLVKPPQAVGTAPEFVDEVRRALVAKYGEAKLPYLGITVVTTCDAAMQRAARAAVESELEALDQRQNYNLHDRKHVPHVDASSPESIKKALVKRAKIALEKRLKNASHEQVERWVEEHTDKALVKGNTVEAVVVKLEKDGVLVDDGGERGFLPLPATRDRYNPKALPVEKRFAPGDVLTVRAEPSLGRTDDNLPILVPELGPQAAAVILDPATREVRALVGGYGFHAGGFDRALRAQRQPGSSFKPFLYATAFASRNFTPASVMDDSPQRFEMTGANAWMPKNAESHEFLGPVRLRTALARSLNTVAAQLICDLAGPPTGNPPQCGLKGAQDEAALAHAMGIESKLDPNLSLAVGTSVVTLLELTNAYATFDAGGKAAPPLFVTKMGDEAEPRPVATQAVAPEVAYLVTSVMQSVIDEGTAVSAKGKLKAPGGTVRPAAGKTGTTNDERDAWFIGFTPDLVTGVWVGFDDMRDLGHGEQGARSALPIWVDIMNAAEKGVPAKPFLQPPGIEVARIDPLTGLRASPTSATGIDEVFLAGTAPQEVAPDPGAVNPDTFVIDQQAQAPPTPAPAPPSP